MRTPSFDGERYMKIIFDQYTHYAETFWIKFQAFFCFELYRKRAQTLRKAKIQILRIDGGGEFNSDAFLSLIRNKGIRLEGKFHTVRGKIHSQNASIGPHLTWRDACYTSPAPLRFFNDKLYCSRHIFRTSALLRRWINIPHMNCGSAISQTCPNYVHLAALLAQ